MTCSLSLFSDPRVLDMELKLNGDWHLIQDSAGNLYDFSISHTTVLSQRALLFSRTGLIDRKNKNPFFHFAPNAGQQASAFRSITVWLPWRNALNPVRFSVGPLELLTRKFWASGGAAYGFESFFRTRCAYPRGRSSECVTFDNYRGFTFSACKPLGPVTTSNCTC